MAFLYGPGDSQTLRPKHRNGRFELTGVGSYSGVPCQIFYQGLTYGGGTNGTAGGDYPAENTPEDGLFISKVDKSANPQAGDGTAQNRITRGTQYFDYAPDASKEVYMLWTSDSGNALNPSTSYDPSPTSNWEPGSFEPENKTGLTGNLEAWFNLTHVQEADLSGYVDGTELTVQKGRFKIAVAGERVIARVIHREGTLSFRASVNTNGFGVKA